MKASLQSVLLWSRLVWTLTASDKGIENPVLHLHSLISLSHLLSSAVPGNYSVRSLFTFGSVLDRGAGEGGSDASVAVCAASAAGQRVGGVVKLGCGKGGR